MRYKHGIILSHVPQSTNGVLTGYEPRPKVLLEKPRRTVVPLGAAVPLAMAMDTG